MFRKYRSGRARPISVLVVHLDLSLDIWHHLAQLQNRKQLICGYPIYVQTNIYIFLGTNKGGRL